jgi:hypothetical protein
VDGKSASPLKTAVFYAIMVLIMLAFGEGTIALLMRLAAVLPKPIVMVLRDYYYAGDQRFVQFMPECARYDPGLTYTLKPGRCHFSAREFDIELEINSLGVRDDEKSLNAPDIVVVGDSMALGWGVGQHQNFADLIEQRTGVKVLNLSVSSYGTVREVEILKRVDLSHMRVLILQYSPNDLTENESFLRNSNKLPILSEADYLAIRDRHLSDTRYYPGKHLVWFAGAILNVLQGKPAFAAEIGEEPRVFFNAMVAKLKELKSLAASDHPPITLVLFGLVWPQATSEAALAAAGGWPVPIDRVIYIPYPSDAAGYYPLDSHLNQHGHELVAMDIIRALQGVPLR